MTGIALAIAIMDLLFTAFILVVMGRDYWLHGEITPPKTSHFNGIETMQILIVMAAVPAANAAAILSLLP